MKEGESHKAFDIIVELARLENTLAVAEERRFDISTLTSDFLLAHLDSKILQNMAATPRTRAAPSSFKLVLLGEHSLLCYLSAVCLQWLLQTLAGHFTAYQDL